MWKDEEIADILNKAVKLSAKLRTPIVRLKMEVENSKAALMNQVTRWNSTYLMLKRLMDLKEFCLKFQDQKGFHDLKVDSMTWDKFEQLVLILEEAATLTTQLQAENLLVPDFIYGWMSMKQKLHSLEGSPYATKLIHCLEERESNIMSNKIILAGWYLDKILNVLMTSDQIVVAKSVIRMVASKKDKIQGKPILEPIPDVSDEEDLELVENNPFESFLRKKGKEKELGNKQHAKLTMSSIEKELKNFEKLPVPRKRFNGIEYWNENSLEFPSLSSVALDIICAPVTEVTVERLFSHLNTILNKNRSRLNGPLLEDILFLRLNERFTTDTCKKN